jgi:hypothetical protein
MPALGKFGFHFAIKRAYIEQPGNGFIYSFDRANHKVRIWLGMAQDAITCNAVTAGTPAGNVAIPATNAAGAGTPAGNVAIPATNAATAGTPAGNLASNVITFDPHSHSLLIASNATGGNILDAIGANAASNSLVSNSANVFTIDGNDAANGGIANATQTGVVNAVGLTMGEMATHIHGAPGNVALVGDAMATHTHGAPGNVALVGDVMATHTHGLAGGGALAEAALAEMNAAVVLAAATHILYMEMVGR